MSEVQEHMRDVLNASVGEGVDIDSGVLRIRGQRIERFQVEREIGRGANGVVFAARRVLLDQPCALKIWLRMRESDLRNKLQQGLAEARKIAVSDPEWVAAVYDADVVQSVLVMSMEMIDGETLKTCLSRELDLWQRWGLARLYLTAIDRTTTLKTAHGDAHTRNVMVFRQGDAMRLKLIDFGTSLFTTEAVDSRRRHWAVVNQTFKEIIQPFRTRMEVIDQLSSVEARLDNREDLIVPYLRDILDGLRIEAGITTPF